MPSIACRDVGVVCDWFIRDPDDANMVIAITRHTEVSHKEEWKEMLKAISAGKMTFSGFMGMSAEVAKYYPGETAPGLSLACKDFGPKECEETVTANGFPVFASAYLVHLEKKHPDFLPRTIKGEAFSKFCEDLRDHVQEQAT
jgi:predicted small metal-binding protein